MKIPCDKFAHIIGGYAVAISAGLIYDPLVIFVSGLFGLVVTGWLGYGPLAGFVLSCIVWAIKELVDWLGFGTPDRYDYIASVIGAAGAVLFLTMMG